MINKLIDMHCHILPGIDDGAKNIEEAVKLLTEQQKQNVKKIVFTPHFHIERISIENFIRARTKSYQDLMNTPEVQDMDIQFKCGAEVFFSNKLIHEDIEKLCFEDTSYLLIEFPTNEKPYGLTYTLTDIINRGITPILAHIERYPYFTEDPVKLYDLIGKGCIAQINAGAVLEGKNSIAMKYIKWELAQIVCSDCHSIDRRPPNLKEGMEFIEKIYGTSYADWMIKNSSNIFKDQYIDMPVIKKPKKFLGRWL